MLKDSAHLSDEQLAQFQDGDLSPERARHLENCPQCGERLREMEAAARAWVQYRDSIRAPLLPAAPRPWPSLASLVEASEAVSTTRKFRRWPVPVLAAAAAIAIAVVAFYRPAESPTVQSDRLLAQSVRATRPHQRRISMRVHGRTMVRPAVLAVDAAATESPEADHLRTLFRAARYDWYDPLSARAFEDWRGGLPDRRDSVSVIGNRESYVVRTDTSSGILRSASLTLRVRDLVPTNGLLKFEGEGDVELAEAPGVVEEPRRQPPPDATAAHVETPAGPEDTLRVLDALNRIGADVGEPVEVSEDPQHRYVIVHTGGLSASRREDVAQALASLKRVTVDTRTAAAPPGSPVGKGTPERYSTNIPAALRRSLEERFGGPIALQQATDDVLDTSASVLARAHAIEVLAAKFPRDVAAQLSGQGQELLRDLRRRHVAALASSAAHLRTELQPLLPTARGASPRSSDAKNLVAAARDLDALLNRLLAGSYSESEGQEMLQRLGAELDGLDAAIQSQGTGER